jgi:hypothetical protein
MRESRSQFNIPQLLSTALIQQEKNREFASTNAERAGAPRFVNLVFNRPLKWDFRLDASFMGMDSENKMIGIRSIAVPLSNIDFEVCVAIRKLHYLNNAVVNESPRGWINFRIYVTEEDGIEKICSAIEGDVNDAIHKYNTDLQFIWSIDDYSWMSDGGQAGMVRPDETQDAGLALLNCSFAAEYSSSDNVVMFKTYSFSQIPALNTGHRYAYRIAIGQPMLPYNDPADPIEVRNKENERLYKVSMENVFRSIFNQHPVDNVVFNEGNAIRMNDVWNRRDLYVHASFSSFPHNLIGRNNEFYTKPSKLYKYDSRSPDIQIWCSLDGKNPVKMYGQDVAVEVELISNVKYPNQY